MGAINAIHSVTPTETLLHLPDIPEDYHCRCEYCVYNFMGNIRTEDAVYAAKSNKTYFPKVDHSNTSENKHLDSGHFQGYRWAIQNLTQPGDWILDPTVGTGTAIIEAINNGRNAVGIELEFPEIAQRNIDAQKPHATGHYIFQQGDVRFLNDHLKGMGIKEETFSLILNGPPYPKMGGKSSDAPERKKWKDEDKIPVGPGSVKIVGEVHKNKSFDYRNPDNIGTLKGKEYWDHINQMYLSCEPFLKPGGFLVTIIKDMTRNKEPYLLHKIVNDEILAHNSSLKLYGSFIHKHWPPTTLMCMYPKRFPEVKLPTYQTGIILQKNGN